VLTDIVEGKNLGMAEPGKGTGFLLEADDKAMSRLEIIAWVGFL